MGKILFTGDLHFGHENVLAFDNRPFATVDEMDAELIRRWNNKVGKGDLVYVLGDLIWKSRNNDAPALIKSLNGQIILIKGNHDRFLHNSKAKSALAGIKDYDDSNIPLKLIQDIMGHADFSTTMDIYTFKNTAIKRNRSMKKSIERDKEPKTAENILLPF